MSVPEITLAETPAADLEPAIVAALHTIYDPEIPVDIYELGLVYDIAVDPETRAKRIELFEQLLPTTLGIIADDDRAGPHSADLLIDMYTAGLTAPTHERIH